MQTFTYNDLLLYVLNETSSTQNVEITKAMQHDSCLQQEIENLQETILEIKSVEFSPNEQLLHSLLEKLHNEDGVCIV